jgi:hypothetical protein
MIVFANVILFFAVSIAGVAFGYHYNNEIAEFIDAVKSFFRDMNVKKMFTKKYWWYRKLEKKGIIKQVYCVMDSFPGDNAGPDVILVKKGTIYNVIGESCKLNWGDIDGSYILLETGESIHSKSVFIDYEGENVEKDSSYQLSILIRRTIAKDLFNNALRNIQKNKIKNFKFLK